MGGMLLMLAARRLKLAAAASLSTMVAAIAIAGPLAGTALAGQKKPTPIPDISVNASTLDSGAMWIDSSHRTNSRSIGFTWTAPSAGTTLTCSVDAGKATQNCSSPSATYSNLANGTHTFLLKGKA